MPNLDAIIQWLIYFGISVSTIVIIIILVLFLYPHLRVFLGDALRTFGWTGKWIRRKSVEFEIEGSINFFCKSINDESVESLLPTCEIKWVTSENQQNILEPGKAIVCLSFGTDHDLNYYNAVSAFVQTGLLPQTKPFLKKVTSRAIELLMVKILLTKNRRNALKIFNKRFREEFMYCSDVYSRLEESEQKGLFSRILLHEYNVFGEIIGDKTPNNIYEDEAEKFLHWFYDLTMRSVGERTSLKFESDHIKVGVILIAKEDTYQEHGIDPYLKWASYYALNNFGSIYLLSRGARRAQLAKKIAQELSLNKGFTILTKRPDIIKKGINEEIHITCIALRPDLTAIIQHAWEHIQRAYIDGKPITVIISYVANDEVTVDAYGLSVKMPLSNLTEMQINDATRYFNVENELLVNILKCDSQQNELILSNVNTDTDPKKLVDKNLNSSTHLECVVKKINSGDGGEYGLSVVDVKNQIHGFIPRSRATYSNFISLKDKYALESIVKASIVDFSPERASYIFKIADLKNPWDDISKYKEGQRVQVIIREISERYLTCELQEGLEGYIFVQELSWGSTADNLAIIKNHRVAEKLEVIITNINLGYKKIYLSVKRLSDNPLQKYAIDNKAKIVSAIVKKIIPMSGVEVITDENSYNGFVPIREITWGYCDNIDTCLSIGQKVNVLIMDYNHAFNNIIMSIKRTIVNNYIEFKSAFNKDDEVSGKIIKCEKDKFIVRIEYDHREVPAYVHKSELTAQFFVDESIMHKILDKEKVYTFVVKRFDDTAQVIELSRKKYLLNKFQTIEYGQQFDVKVVRYKNDTYAFANDMEAILIQGKRGKIEGDQYIRVIPARIDREKRRIEVQQIN